ncbi:Prolyl oligopeptidase family protein [Jatrophihabitans endophyticus]|uniref:Prolyl oligopeptidase family protein n=1 Tax=Jatrophihabitans endophyticus TaxID=1206085 RepID=A0A1M5KF34_9ACTN|nr:alpha/beta hydrolase [Jatrophihabitans endophyticus]SHG51412.1 Prolyl oligopeptidase family protein [Jatrophihabitans endophyticus]
MPTRRAFLGAAALGALAGCTGSGAGTRHTPSTGQDAGVTPKRIAYGDDPSQFGELTLPGGAPRGVVVVIHGGFWRAQYDLSLGRPLATDLAAHGWATWNLEYRRVGDGGGWPTTLRDVAAGIDRLGDLDLDLDLDTAAVVAVGHSAGGQLAVWAAGRAGLRADDPGARPAVTLAGVVSQAGVLDLATAARTGVGDGAPQQFVGGEPTAVPERYRVADPITQVPLAAPVLCLHAKADANVPYAQSRAYVAAARDAGGHAALRTTEGDHFTLIDTATTAWAAARDALPALAAGRLPA